MYLNTLIVYNYAEDYYYPVVEVNEEKVHVTDLRIYDKKYSMILIEKANYLYDCIAEKHLEDDHHSLSQCMHPWGDVQESNKRFYLEEYNIHLQ